PRRAASPCPALCRSTTADVFLPLGRTPANLTVQADSQVADLAFEGARATGVRLLDGTVVEAGWVVLCAGTYGTPSILMRSGIGPDRKSTRLNSSHQI